MHNSSLKIGYAGVSTEEQNLDLQLDKIGQGDVLVVWKLDRLGRSLSFLISLVEELGERGVGFQSFSDGIDTSTAGGQLVFHIMGAVAEFERALIVEGMEARKAPGKA